MGEYTQDGYDRLVKQVADLEAAHKVALASLGDAAEADSNTWHDNPAFDEANRAIRTAAERLAKAKRLLADAMVVEVGSNGVVNVGSVVTYEFVGEGEAHTILIAGRHVIRAHDDEIMHVSTSSPLGAAIWGHTVGDDVAYVAPNGRTFVVKITSVS